MPHQRVAHRLRLPAGTDLDAVDRLARARHPAAQHDADGTLVLTRHSVLSAAEVDGNGRLVRTAGTLRERGDAPLPGQVDPVGLYRAFADGVPVREERRVLDLLVGLARRLDGEVEVEGDAATATLNVDPLGRLDLTVHSPIALDPHQVLAAVTRHEPTGRLAMDGYDFVPADVPDDELPELVRGMGRADRAEAEAFSRWTDERALAGPDVLDAFAVEVQLGGLGTLVVEAHAHEDELPPLVRARRWREVIGYDVRWLAPDPFQAETDHPDETFVAAREAVRPRLRAVAGAVCELAPGEVLDADGLPVDRWTL